MNAFSKRYFLIILSIFLLFLILGVIGVSAIFLAIFTFILAILALNIKVKNLRVLCILLIISGVLGAARAELLHANNSNLIDRYSGNHEVVGYILESSARYPYMSESVVKIESIDGNRTSFKAVIVSDFSLELDEGDFFSGTISLSPLSQYEDTTIIRNNNPYDYPLIGTVIREGDIKGQDGEIRASVELLKLNSKLSGTILTMLSNNVGGLASALLLGNREFITDNYLRDFKRAGVYHMLALSGMHVAILIGMADRLLKRMKAHPRVRIAALSALSFLYVALTGFHLSACRALIMLWMVYLSAILRGRTDSMTSLFIAASVIAIISPSAILDVGFQLSFASTFGVIASSMIQRNVTYFKKCIHKGTLCGKFLELIRTGMRINLTSVCVFVATLPLVMIYFGEVSVATFFSNIFMGVICEAFILFSSLALIFSGITGAGNLFAFLANIFGSLMLNIVEWISGFDGVMLSLLYPRTEYIVILLLVLSLIFFGLKLKRKWMLGIPSILFVILFSINVFCYGGLREGEVRVEFVFGDSLIISTSDEVYICDASNGRYGNLYDAVSVARQNCLTKIDGVVLSHYHSYHAISLKKLASGFKVDSVYLPIPQNEQEATVLDSIYLGLKDTKTKIYVYESNVPINILGGELKVSERAFNAEYTHPSVALSYTLGERKIALVERPYFDSYLELNRRFEEEILQSEVVIFGGDGHMPDNRFEIFYNLKKGAEIVFCDREHLLTSDFEKYLSDFSIYVDVEYKKYDLKR